MQSADMLPEPTAETNPQPDEFQDLERLTAQHGKALDSLACIILADREAAEKAVSNLLSKACTTNAEWSRRLLSRQLYLNCTWARLNSLPSGHSQSADVRDDTIAELGERSEQQRAAIALSFYGAHSFLQIAELLHLETAIVLNLMRSGLDELYG